MSKDGAPESSSHEKEMEFFQTLFKPEEAADLSRRLLDQDPTLLDDIRERGKGHLSESFLENLRMNLGLLIIDDETCTLALTHIQKITESKLNRKQKRALSFFLDVLQIEEEKEVSMSHIFALRSIALITPQYSSTISSCIGYLLGISENSEEEAEED